jgi:hypothetical protein
MTDQNNPLLPVLGSRYDSSVSVMVHCTDPLKVMSKIYYPLGSVQEPYIYHPAEICRHFDQLEISIIAILLQDVC